MKKIIRAIIPQKLRRTFRVSVVNIKRILKGERKIKSKNTLLVFSMPRAHTFFGYYDISPFNANDNILYLELGKDEQDVKIVVNTLNDTDKQYIATTKAWNWQQGCRLRWFAESDATISFNDFNGTAYFNRIISLESKEEKIIGWPLYDIDKKGHLGLSLNFARLGVLRPGYGYTCTQYNLDNANINNEGIDIIDIDKNRVIQRVTYKNILEVVGKYVNLHNCYINHLSFSPSGEKFLFFWIEIINGFHQASLMVYDMITKKIVPLETDMKVSHYVWKDDNTIICTAYNKNYECRYYKYLIEEKEKAMICPTSLKSDGHPSFIGVSKLLTDTYPDGTFFQHLYIADVENDTKKELIKIYSDPFVTGERRTDLHPRLNAAMNYACFDANVSGYRKLYLTKI